MAEVDKVRWDAKYQTYEAPSKPISLVEKYIGLADGTKALDIACGMGRHTIFLAQNGFEVDALDISSIALQTLQNRENITPFEVDFDTHILEKDTYDLVVCTYFLERKLFSQMLDCLKEGGVLLMETFVYDALNENAPLNTNFLLQPSELKEVFSKSCEVLFYEEKFSTNPKGEKVKIGSLAASKRSVS